MKKYILLVIISISSFGISQESQELYHRAKIYYNSAEGFLQLNALDIALEHGIHKRGYYIISEFSASEIAKVRNAGFEVEILIEDAKEHFLQQNRYPNIILENPGCNNSTVDYPTPANFDLGSMGGYLTYQELLDELDQMHSLYPNLITAKENIGSFLTEGQPDASVTPSIGGNGIKWVKISDNPNASNEGEPQVLYNSIHHAREPASLMQLVFYMWYLLENYDSDPEIRSIVDNTELYFVPVVNPDGYLYNQVTDPNGGGFWRKNRKNGTGTDNNRNYNYFINGNPSNSTWSGPGSSSNPGSETYHGTAPFSEVENQAMKFFVEQHNFVLALNNHTSGQLLYYPFSYADVPTPEEQLFEDISAELVSQNGYFALRDFPFSGDSDDFMYGTVGTHNKIYSFTPEIGTSFWPPSSQIIPIAKNMMYLNLTAARMTSNYGRIIDTAPTYTGNQAVVNTTFELKNLGIAGTGTFTVNISPVSNNIVFAGAPVNFNGLQPLEGDQGSISYQLAPGTASGDDIIFDLVVNNGSYSKSTRINKKFGSLNAVFSDSGNSVNDNFINNGWTTTGSTFVSPSSSITDSNGNYPNNTNETITLNNPVDLTSANGAIATFYARWDIENDFDYVQFEVSIDGGSTWEAQCGKYTNLASATGAQPIGEPLYDGEQLNWIFEEVDLSDYLGNNILVRFQLVSDNGQRADGFYFDDLKINVVEEFILDVTDNAQLIFNLFPNPVSSELNIVSNASAYNIELYDLQGKKLFTSYNLNGDLKLDYSLYSSGIYLLKITTENFSKTYKLIKE